MELEGERILVYTNFAAHVLLLLSAHLLELLQDSWCAWTSEHFAST